MFPSFKFLGVNLYYWGDISAFIIGMLFSVWYSKKYQINFSKWFLLIAWMAPTVFSTMYIVSYFDAIGGVHWVRGIIFMPLVIYLLCSVLDMTFTKTLDFLAPCIVIAPGIAHIFCAFSGCCYGYPSSFGIWNERQHAYLFPVQWCEAATYLLIFWFMVRYAKKKSYETHGISYAQYLFLFGLTRTFWEFFRDYTEQRWQISIFQYYSFAAFVIGALWLGITFYLQKHPEFIKRHELLFREDLGELTRIRMFLRKRKI